jgi:ribosomal protein S18 acetylase RimI-like enzyme
MTIQFRPFENSDYARARALWEATPGIGLSNADAPAAIQAFLERNPGTSFVAVDGEVLVGTILCGHDGRRGLIHHLVTASTHRHMGVGTSLLRAGLKALRERGIDKCHLFVFRSNDAGLSFWRAVAAQERTELALFSLATDDAC